MPQRETASLPKGMIVPEAARSIAQAGTLSGGCLPASLTTPHPAPGALSRITL